jgi:hypothetical protein
MSIEPTTGTIVWGPTLHQLAVHDVVLRKVTARAAWTSKRSR